MRMSVRGVWSIVRIYKSVSRERERERVACLYIYIYIYIYKRGDEYLAAHIHDPYMTDIGYHYYKAKYPPF